jgi:hypothetical protein
MMASRRHSVIKALLALALLCCAALAVAAQVAGTVMHLNGPLLAKKADGSAKILAVKSEVEQGDTLVTEKNTYALIKFIDNSEITLRPGTAFTIDQFAFEADKADADSAAFTLIKGGLRSLTGLLGKRNKERFSLKTPAATIGIRGTTFIVQYVLEGEQALAASCLASNTASTATAGACSEAGGAAVLAPGLYVHVIDGLISLSNRGGTQSFSAGQFGFTPSFTSPPTQVPNLPTGIQFSPPPAFSSTTSGGQGGTGRINGEVNCIVR